MSHTRTDSAMVHSSRRSYKHKLNAALQNAPFNHENAVQTLELQNTVNAVYESERLELIKHTTSLALAAQDAARAIDVDDLSYVIRLPHIGHSVDRTLVDLNIPIIIRRSRDIIKKKTEQAVLLAAALVDINKKYNELLTSASLMKTSTARMRDGYIETYRVGRNATEEERVRVVENETANPRVDDGEYLSADDDDEYSANEDSDNEDSEEANMLAILRL